MRSRDWASGSGGDRVPDRGRAWLDLVVLEGAGCEWGTDTPHAVRSGEVR